MNPLDKLLPPSPRRTYSRIDGEELLLHRARLDRLYSQRKASMIRRRRKAHSRLGHDNNMSRSSDSEDDASPPFPAIVDPFTPQGDTPTGDAELAEGVEKLVVVDEKDIGMKSGLKHLYSKHAPTYYVNSLSDMTHRWQRRQARPLPVADHDPERLGQARRRC